MGSAYSQTVEYIHTDSLGSPVAVTDANQNVIERSEYAPYGDLLNRADKDGPRYTGHVQDAATGMSYMQQRYYDPELGVFLSVDPVTALSDPIGQFNVYHYASNNPYFLIDSNGRLDIPTIPVTVRGTRPSMPAPLVQDIEGVSVIGFRPIMASMPAPTTQSQSSCTLVAPTGQYTTSSDVDARFNEDTAQMLSAALGNLNQQGITPVITSGYRSPSKQAGLAGC